MSKDNFAVKNSAIHGKGLFAKKAFKKGDILFYSYSKNDHPGGASWEQQFEPSELIMFPNHSNSPSARNEYKPELKAVFLVATKDLIVGEEITTNYQNTIDLDNSMGYKHEFDILHFQK